MKKKCLFIVLLTQLGFSQAPAIEWQKCIGGTGDDFAVSMQQTPDGGYILAGGSNSTNGDVSGNHGEYDCWIVKINASGAIQWQKTLGGTGDEYANEIQLTIDGGYILTGHTGSNNGDVSGLRGSFDFWVVKLSISGTIEWQKTLGGTNIDMASSVQQTSDGGYIVAGVTLSNNGDVTGNHGSYDYWVVKLDSTGIIQWQKALGGTGYDYATDVKPTLDGGYIVTGYAYSNNGDVTGNHYGADYWVVKLSTTGAIQWQKALGGGSEDFAYSIQQTLDSGYIVAGYTTSNSGDVSGNHGNQDYWIVKLDTFGGIQWQKTLGGTVNDSAFSIQTTSDGGYIVGGGSYSNDGNVTGNHLNEDYWVVKLNNFGEIQWQKSLGGTGNDRVLSILSTPDGGYTLAGYSDSNNGDVTGNHGARDIWIVKLGNTLSTTIFNNNLFKLFPNPTASVLTVQSATNLVFDKMTVTDISGKTVLEQTQNTNQINVEPLASGMYILQAFSSEEKFTAKFVKN